MMTKINWMNRICNVEVLRDVKEQRKLLRILEKIKTKLLGHFISHNKFIANLGREIVREDADKGRDIWMA